MPVTRAHVLSIMLLFCPCLLLGDTTAQKLAKVESRVNQLMNQTITASTEMTRKELERFSRANAQNLKIKSQVLEVQPTVADMANLFSKVYERGKKEPSKEEKARFFEDLGNIRNVASFGPNLNQLNSVLKTALNKAEESPGNGSDTPPVSELKEMIALMERLRAAQQKVNDFGGFQFGGGFLATLGGGKETPMASLVGSPTQRLYVSKETVNTGNFCLETHYYCNTWEDKCNNASGPSKRIVGWGPFLAISPDSKGIGAYSLGVLIGARDLDGNARAWNFGLGYYCNQRAIVLGDGLISGSTLPEGEVKERFKEVTKGGLSIVISASF